MSSVSLENFCKQAERGEGGGMTDSPIVGAQLSPPPPLGGGDPTPHFSSLYRLFSDDLFTAEMRGGGGAQGLH